jgi:hypothetical protein
LLHNWARFLFCARRVTTFKRFDGTTCQIFRNWACDLFIHSHAQF